MIAPLVTRAPGLALAALAAFAPTSVAQELPPSGSNGIDLIYATSPAGTSQLYAVAPGASLVALPVGAPVNAVPSRWAHRRRTLGALETAMTYVPPALMMTPMGDAVGNGAIHTVDGRAGLPPTTVLVPAGNPAGYDLAVDLSLQYVFAVEDDGAGGTTLRGFSYAFAGQLVPLTPATLSLTGPPSAYVNRVGVDEAGDRLHVPTTDGIAVVQLASAAPHMSVQTFFTTTPQSPATNPATFERNGASTWAIGTSRFGAPVQDPVEAGFFVWDHIGSFDSGTFGPVPGVANKLWVPAAGTEELAVVSNGTDAYVYYLLREPGPGTFFVKASAIGVARLIGAAPAVASTILCPQECGEPFANPAVHGGRVAIESSFGPPFVFDPPGGGERVSVLYSPLDSLGAATTDGLLAVPGPLGGRISTKGMDRPLWTLDGSRVVACTSHFPGAPNPFRPGIEVLDVPSDLPVNEWMSPHTVVNVPAAPDRSIIFPSIFDPRDGMPSFLTGMSFVGNVFHDGMASILALPFGEMGQQQVDSLTQSPAIPNFPAIFPPSFDDPNGSLTPVPASFGARRTTFNLVPGLGFAGVIMTAALADRVLIQPAGNNHLASLGIATPANPVPIALPAGWVTTTEFLSL